MLPIYLPSIWPLHSSQNIHKSATSGGRVALPTWTPLCNISGRSPDNGRWKGKGCKTMRSSKQPVRVCRLPYKLHKVTDRASPVIDVSRFGGRLQQEGIEPPLSEGIQNKVLSTESPQTAHSLSKDTGPGDRQAVSNSTGSTASSTPLPKLAATKTLGIHVEQELRPANSDIIRGQARSEVVDPQNQPVEWQEPTNPLARAGGRNRCISTGWGAYCHGNLTGGRWSEEEKTLHINKLELLAAMISIQAFLKDMREVSVLLKSDNVRRWHTSTTWEVQSHAC